MAGMPVVSVRKMAVLGGPSKLLIPRVRVFPLVSSTWVLYRLDTLVSSVFWTPVSSFGRVLAADGFHPHGQRGFVCGTVLRCVRCGFWERRDFGGGDGISARRLGLLQPPNQSPRLG